jgi:hypothetical protein
VRESLAKVASPVYSFRLEAIIGYIDTGLRDRQLNREEQRGPWLGVGHCRIAHEVKVLSKNLMHIVFPEMHNGVQSIL